MGDPQVTVFKYKVTVIHDRTIWGDPVQAGPVSSKAAEAL